MDPFGSLFDDTVKDRSLHRKGADAVIDAAPVQRTTQSAHTALGSPMQSFSLQPMLVVLGIVFAGLISRVFYLQIVEGASYRQRADGNRTEQHITKALRGVVYDADGNLLVKNVPNFQVVVNAQDVGGLSAEQLDAASREIASTIERSPDEIRDALYTSAQTGENSVVLDEVPYTEALELMITTQHVNGVRVETAYNREYLAGETYSHLLGYTGKLTAEEYETVDTDEYQLNDTIGKIGLEKSYEGRLRGSDGHQEVEVDFQGHQRHFISEKTPIAGENIHLSIDPDLQQQLYEAIAQHVDENNLPGGSAVAIDPRTGALKALVTYPSYDNNIFVGGVESSVYADLLADEHNPLFFRPVSGQYPSGSVFKPIVAAAALEEGVITPSTSYLSSGGLQIDQFYFPDWKAGGHGQTNVTKALAESVNTFFYLVGGGDNETSTGLGVDRIVEYGKRFGLADYTGIDVPGEQAGFLPSKGWKEEFKNEPWYLGDTYHLAIGQGDILVTPLQVAVYTAIIANGGTYYEPYTVQQTTDQEGAVTYTHEPLVKAEQIVSASSMATVQKGMREAVEYGSARSLQSLPVSSAGKTGTAQFGAEDKTHSWFTSYAPYEQPEIALAVLIEEGGGGNDAALPIAREVLQKYFSPEEE